MTLIGHGERITRAVFSPDGTLLATGSGDGTARLWSLSTGSARAVWRVHNIPMVYWTHVEVAFNPDGTLLAIGGSDRLLLVEVSSGRILADLSLESTVMGLAFNPDGTLLASSGMDSVVRLWGILVDEESMP